MASTSPPFRLDRALTMQLSLRWHRTFREVSRRRVPVLMYHGIRPTSGNVSPYFETHTSAAVFEQQMRYLREHHYQAIDLHTALQVVREERVLSKPVVITFDDGLLSFYRHALPILVEYRHSATMFAVSRFMEETTLSIAGDAWMTGEQLRESQSLGMTIGSHTATHPRLQTLRPGDISRELQRSKDVLQQALGTAVNSFSYPYAFPEPDDSFLQQLRLMLVESGYDVGVTTVLGTMTSTSDHLFLPRLPINDYDDLRFFEAKLSGAYDWLHTPQFVYKALRHFAGRRRSPEPKPLIDFPDLSA